MTLWLRHIPPHTTHIPTLLGFRVPRQARCQLQRAFAAPSSKPNKELNCLGLKDSLALGDSLDLKDTLGLKDSLALRTPWALLEP